MSYCVEKELYRSRKEATVLSSGNEGYCAVPEYPTSHPCFTAACRMDKKCLVHVHLVMCMVSGRR